VIDFATQVETHLGPAAVVVNNAAVLGPVGVLEPSGTGDWSRTLDINVKGVANVIAAFSTQLRAGHQGRVVNLSGGGVGGPSPMMRTSAYVVSKFAVAALTEVLAEEFEGSSVTVNAVAPGPLPTRFLAGVLDAGPDVAGNALYDDALGRDDTLDDHHVRPFLNLLDYLIEAESYYLNGRVLSARWDQPGDLRSLRSSISPNLFRLRRIDSDLFAESMPTR
jgi:NAD(P)-dependent dehydrogenase (short-subunit alcohol dehydrogenase family)